ncbi:unnamed protein product [Fusarium graminearum]|nr:unnamed protein product [Fusarium graminearum]
MAIRAARWSLVNSQIMTRLFSASRRKQAMSNMIRKIFAFTTATQIRLPRS